LGTNEKEYRTKKLPMLFCHPFKLERIIDPNSCRGINTIEVQQKMKTKNRFDQNANKIQIDKQLGI